MTSALDDPIAPPSVPGDSGGDAVAAEGESPDDELVQARAAARRSEQELGQALARLEQSILEPFDLRAQISGAPLQWLAGAFLIGLMIGRIRSSSQNGDH